MDGLTRRKQLLNLLCIVYVKRVQISTLNCDLFKNKKSSVVHPLHTGSFFMLLLLSAGFYQSVTQFDSDVGPDQGPSCLQRLSADEKSGR